MVPDTRTGTREPRAVDHHALPVHEVVVLMGTDQEHGLGEAEAARRLQRLGPNRLPAPVRPGPVRRFLAQLRDPLVYVLLAACAGAAALGEVVDASVIAAVVLVNAVVGFVQEQRAQGALDALAAMVQVRATVVRDGHVRELPAEEVVPGDVVLLGEGDRVPADLRLVRVDELAVDESALTGESLPVAKRPLQLPGRAVLADRTNMAWSGTLVTRGRGRGVVVAHAGDTELGRVHRLMETADDLATPLTRTIARFSGGLTVVILALSALFGVVGLLRGLGPADVLTASVALAVAAIPEGLPAVVTITLAVGVTRMARRGAIIRRLPAVETLGSTTTICSDKTGTLTENRQTVQHVLGEADAVLLTAVLCNDARVQADGELVGDPTETALLSAAAAHGLDVRAVRAAVPRTATLPFSSERRLMATRHGGTVHVKGAAEAVLDRIGTGPGERDRWLAEVHRLAEDGLRVLACASGPAPQASHDSDLDEQVLDRTGLRLQGVVAMADPPRAAAVAAVAACRRAGVRVAMITGDHAATARSVGRQVGLAGGREPVVVTGQDLARVPDERLAEVAAGADVFARVSPEDKLRLVRALQREGQVVAMTGDGVNDAPALEQADIGVAMGRSGTEVAQEAADMVLTDDDFASIEAAVEEGRGVFDNLVRFIAFALPTNLGQALVILTAVALGTALPITPVQVLWVNLTTAVLLGLPLAVEPRVPGIMERPPRAVGAPLVGARELRRMLLVSALLLVGAFGAFQVLVGGGAPEAEARTVAVNLFVLAEVGYLLACRSFDRSLAQLGWRSNPWVVAGIAGAVALQLLFTYAPVMHVLFGTAPVPWTTWLYGLGYAVVVWCAVDALRLLERARTRRVSGRPRRARRREPSGPPRRRPHRR